MKASRCLLVLGLAGCVAEPRDDLSSAVQATEEQFRPIFNAPISNGPISNAPISNGPISKTPLGAGRFSLDSEDMRAIAADPQWGPRLIQKLVACALPPSVTVSLSVPGHLAAYEYRGVLGLGAEWLMGPLSPRGERLVSSCLAALHNGAGITGVELSLRADEDLPFIGVSPEEASEYDAHEMTIEANLFVDPPRLLVWKGAAQYGDTCGEWSPYLVQRICGSSAEACGYSIQGWAAPRCSRVTSYRHHDDCLDAVDVVRGDGISVFLRSGAPSCPVELPPPPPEPPRCDGETYCPEEVILY